MDIRIENGDIVLNANGDYARIDGIEEAVQRVRIAAMTDRGTFIYNRSLGIDRDAFSAIAENAAAQLDMLIREATADMDGVECEVISYDAENHNIVIKVSYRGRSAVTEVNVSGII